MIKIRKFNETINLLFHLENYWRWDISYPSYQAVKNPVNVIEKTLQVHEEIEYKELFNIWERNPERKDNDILKKQDYEKCHKIANREMIKFLISKIPELVEYTERNIIRVLAYIWDKFYPVNKNDELWNESNPPELKNDRQVNIYNILRFYTQDIDKNASYWEMF